MRIAYLLGSLNRGGTETLLLDVFRNAKHNNLDAVGVYRKTGALESDFLESGVFMYKLLLRKNIIGYLYRLRKLLKRKEISTVHAQQPIDALLAWLACRATGIKIILTLHGYDFIERRLSSYILRFIIRQTDTNIFVSNTQLKYYQQKYGLNPNNQQVVYNGISFEKFDILSSHHIHQMTLSHQMSNEEDQLSNEHDVTNQMSKEFKTLRDELHLSPETLLLGTVGNFVSVRDQQTICRFLKLLFDEKVNFHFVFVGKRDENMPHLYNDCVSYCKQNGLSHIVTFLDSRNDVPYILSQLDTFIYSTDHDTFGIAVVEAMTVGIPVFVNDWGVMNEITDKGKYATLYKTKSEQDLLREFMLFLQHQADYKAKAVEGSAFVREKYSIERHIERLKEVYQETVNDKRSI